jgi:hypothetical protein
MTFDFEIDSSATDVQATLFAAVSPCHLFKETHANVGHDTLNTALLHTHENTAMTAVQVHPSVFYIYI